MKDRPARPMSPCVNICTLDDELVCMGCFRTLDEVMGWAQMTGEQQWALVDDLRRRADSRGRESTG